MTEFENNEKQVINTSQEIYDAFNSFIFSNDTKVLAKLIARTNLFNQVRDVPGDIVEAGVFKGSGILTWLKLKKILDPTAFKKVIGFDFFDTEGLLQSLSGHDRERMENLFNSRKFSHKMAFYSMLMDIIYNAGFNNGDFELIRGDIIPISGTYALNRPGAKISLLYMDLDLEEPTYQTLQNLWPMVSKGGLVVFDEYAYHQWSETIGADRFAEENGLEIKPLPYNAPTAYIKK